MNPILINSQYRVAELSKSVERILKRTKLCSIASVSADGSSYIHTAYFAFDDKLRIYFLSDPNAQHSRNIRKNQTVAVSVYDSSQDWVQLKRGLQLFGNCHLGSLKEQLFASVAYATRFAEYGKWFRALKKAEQRAFKSKFYVIEVHRLKIFDEPQFGEETFVEVTVSR